MKKLQHTLLFLLAITISTTTQAQLSGLLKKAKDKVTEKAAEKKATVQTTTTTESVATSSSNTLKGNSAEYEWAEDNKNYGYGFQGGAGYTFDRIKQKQRTLQPLTHIRKIGEKGSFHFAKDYPELKSLIKDGEQLNATIQFSGTPFKNDKGDGKTSFSSTSDHIYVLVMANSGTIKDVMKIKDDTEFGIRIGIFIYNDNTDKISGGIFGGNFMITPQMAMEKSFILDIMPAKENVVNLYMATSFYFMHTEEYFGKAGNYKIRVCVQTPLLDDWGKVKRNENLETNAFFDYNFNISDAVTRMNEGRELATKLKEDEEKAPVAIPDEWTLKSGTPMAGYSVAKYNQMYLNEYPGVKIVKTYLSPDAGWGVVKDNDNITPSYKYSGQWVTYFVRNSKGECYYQTCNLRKNYEGGGSYGATYFAAFSNEIKYLDCNKMK